MAKEETLSFRQMKKTYAIADATLKSLAVTLIALGASFVEEGKYELGGLLVTIGWVLFMVDAYVV